METQSIFGLILLVFYLLVLVGLAIGLYIYSGKIREMKRYCRKHCNHYYWSYEDNRSNPYYYQYCVYLNSLSYKRLKKECEYLKSLQDNETI